MRSGCFFIAELVLRHVMEVTDILEWVVFRWVISSYAA
jgi:hypothetical protein